MHDDDPVRLMHHDPRWRQEFEQSRSSILQSCAGWVIAIEHIGSTSISGLIARPTIDMIAAVNDHEGIEPAALLIEGLNYGREPPPDWAVTSTVLVKPRHPQVGQTEPTHRVFLVVKDSSLWDRTIQLRQWLRASPETAIRFEEAKVARWRRGEGERGSYEADKALYFAHLEDQIDAARRPSHGAKPEPDSDRPP